MEELISVIIPVYNVEKFLVECLDSVINQTYKNLEIIIINDGSTDNSYEICKKYEKIDSRVKLISQENKGLSVARNVGIENSTGNILMFIDSDDYVHKEIIAILYDNLKKHNADISFCDYSSEKDDIKITNKDNAFIWTSYDMYNALYDKHSRTVNAWMRLYKKHLFDDIRYPEGKIYEDAFVIHKIIDKSKKFVYSDNKLYFYRVNKKSITHSRYSLKNMDYLEYVLERLDFMKMKGYDYFYAREFYRYVNGIRVNYKGISRYYPKEIEKKKKLILEFNKWYNKKNRKLIIRKRIRFGLDLFHLKSLFLEKSYRNRE